MTGNGLDCWDDLEVLRKYLPDEPVWAIGMGRAATPEIAEGIMGALVGGDCLNQDFQDFEIYRMASSPAGPLIWCS